jgi:hypothetical protein
MSHRSQLLTNGSEDRAQGLDKIKWNEGTIRRARKSVSTKVETAKRIGKDPRDQATLQT